MVGHDVYVILKLQKVLIIITKTITGIVQCEMEAVQLLRKVLFHGSMDQKLLEITEINKSNCMLQSSINPTVRYNHLYGN